MSERPIAANRNDADTVSATAGTSDDVPSGLSSGSSSGSLLVVECRRDDRWRVELCTDLSELDGALDMARALRSAPDVDEVCLTLEVSGAHGRESRREVLRFTPEMAAYARTRDQTPAIAPSDAVDADTVHPVTPSAVGAEAMAVFQASLKAPDYCLDDLDFSQFVQPEQPAVQAGEVSEMSVDANDARLPFDDEEPIVISDSAPTEEQSRTSARALLNSLYNNEPDPFDDENAIRVSVPQTPPPMDSHDWLDRTEPPSGSHTMHHRRLEADDKEDGDSDDAVVRLESSLLGHQNALASKLLVFAGTVALLVLGGALAELLAVDITTAANAGVGAFDTLATLQGDLSR
ncbi:MAG: hypothetical protein HQ501_02565 [Rhodospirillales bacterium]|nr:hypothetical protein [Rhodospirillales bacterium]